MQNMYITRNGKEIQLTEEEIRKAYYIYDDFIREANFELYKNRVKECLDRAKENWEDLDVKINDKVIEHIAYSIRKSVEEFGNDEEWCFDTDLRYGGFYEFYSDVMSILGKEKEK